MWGRARRRRPADARDHRDGTGGDADRGSGRHARRPLTFRNGFRTWRKKEFSAKNYGYPSELPRARAIATTPIASTYSGSWLSGKWVESVRSSTGAPTPGMLMNFQPLWARDKAVCRPRYEAQRGSPPPDLISTRAHPRPGAHREAAASNRQARGQDRLSRAIRRFPHHGARACGVRQRRRSSGRPVARRKADVVGSSNRLGVWTIRRRTRVRGVTDLDSHAIGGALEARGIALQHAPPDPFGNSR